MKSLLLFVCLSLLATACAGNDKGLLQSYTLVHTKFSRPMNFSVLRAPEDSDVDPRTLPVVVLLHGMGDDDLAFDKYKVSDAMIKNMESGAIPRAHFILPAGEKGFYVNWHDGTHPYEDHIIRDVVRIAEDVLRVSPTRENRHIVGVSMGGQGAIRLGLTYPELFGTVTAFSTLILDRKKADELMSNGFLRWLMNADAVFGSGKDKAFNDRMDPYLLLSRVPEDTPQRFYMASGIDESKEFHGTMSAFKKALDAKGVENQYVRYNGGHGWRWWTEMLEKSLSWTLSPPRKNDTADASGTL